MGNPLDGRFLCQGVDVYYFLPVTTNVFFAFATTLGAHNSFLPHGWWSRVHGQCMYTHLLYIIVVLRGIYLTFFTEP